MASKGQFQSLEQYKQKYGEKEGYRKWNSHANRQKLILNKDDLDGEVTRGNALRCLGCGYITTRLQHTHFTHKCKIPSLKVYKETFPGEPTVAPNLAQNQAITLSKMIQKYGKEEGEQKWKVYCDRQAETNTLEYKAEKYGRDKKQFDEYNGNRATTLTNFISRHGEEEGLIRWEIYCERQRYTTSEAYFIKEYGEELGRVRFADFSRGRSCVDFKNLMEKEVLTELNSRLENKLSYQKHVSGIPGCFDFGINKKLIEFNGDYWHCNPTKYSPDFLHTIKNKFAHQIWENDSLKRESAVKMGYQVRVIWEHDWINNRELVLTETLEWLNAS